MAGLRSYNRRDFLKMALAGSAGLYALSASEKKEFLKKNDIVKLTVLYTNDQHSRIDPFPENDAKYPGEGGFVKRSALIEKIRKEEENVLLLDAGDIFQGTPYFNFYQGELEYKLMSLMQYDAVTFGNHDFDLGVENLIKQMPHASFDFINCNYNFSNTDLNKHSKIFPYRIYKKQGLKIGVIGVGIDLNGLIDKKNRQDLEYNNPVEQANKTAQILKQDLKCDYVICLSHLGYKYDSDKISDIVLAQQSKNIDLIIGGHTHTFLEQAHLLRNLENKEVCITQAGWAGIWLGKVEIFFNSYNKNFLQNNTPHKIS